MLAAGVSSHGACSRRARLRGHWGNRRLEGMVVAAFGVDVNAIRGAATAELCHALEEGRPHLSTLIYAELALSEGRLRYACAGHPRRW